MKIQVLKAIAGIAALSLAIPVLAQSWPNKPIRVMVGLPPGSSADLVPRSLQPEMQKILGQPMVIENRPGAAGLIAAQFIVRSDPDGYTILHGGSGVSQTSIFYKENYLTLSQLQTITVTTNTPYLLYVNAKLPVQSVPDLVAYAKGKKLNTGSSGITTDLMHQGFMDRVGIQAEIIRYPGVAVIAPQLVSGELQFALNQYLPVISSQYKSGALRILFVTSEKRFPELPNIPTAAEVGLQNYTPSTILYFVAPAGIPMDIARKIASAATTVLRTPEIQKNFRETQGAEAIGGTPEEAVKTVERELAYWTEATRAAGYKPQ